MFPDLLRFQARFPRRPPPGRRHPRPALDPHRPASHRARVLDAEAEADEAVRQQDDGTARHRGHPGPGGGRRRRLPREGARPGTGRQRRRAYEEEQGKGRGKQLMTCFRCGFAAFKSLQTQK